ncbi:MBL fold metallo-hydrolase [Pseudomonas sp. LB3P14]
MNRTISTLDGKRRKLDGGVMFGSTPRESWARWATPDHDNRVELASRGLLVQQDGRNVLVLAGADALLAPAPRTCRCQPGSPGLLDSLGRYGLNEHDIHVVLLIHLHAQLPADLSAMIKDGETPRLLFPAARYITSKRHWTRARQPHPRDRALFVPQILRQLESSGRLDLIEGPDCDELGDGWRFHVSDGYTPGQLLPEIDMPGGPVIFAGDLVPGRQWLQLNVTSAYDRNPESLIDEKERLLDYLVASGGRLILPRDPEVAMVSVVRDRQSRYVPFDPYQVLNGFDT